MKATFQYLADEVFQIILDHHTKQFPAPDGMEWEAHPAGYGSGAVTVEAVEKIPNAPAPERPRQEQ